MTLFSLIKRASRWFSELSIGGSWGQSQSPTVQHNLRSFWFDGLFSSAGDSITSNYTNLYMLTFGVTQAQIGLGSSISNFLGAMLLLPAAYLAQRSKSCKKIVLMCGGGISRLIVLLFVFLPILFPGQNIVWLVMGLAIARDVINNFGYPAWMAVTNQIVPSDGRGRYFGARNFIISVIGIGTTLLAGKLISLFVQPLGYQIALAVAFVLSAFSTLSYAQIKENQTVAPEDQPNLLQFKELKKLFVDQPLFAIFVITMALWNFSNNITGPFFTVYSVQTLNFSIAAAGFLAVIPNISALFFQNQIGAISDRIGPRRIQLISMILIPLLPLGWTLAGQVWHVAVINTFGGILWAAFNLAQFNLLLATIPPDKVPLYSAIYQVMITLSLSGGALLGSYLIATKGFVIVCITSALLRWVSTLLFAALYQPKKHAGTLAGIA